MAELTCIICPMGCRLTVEGEAGKFKISGNRCPRGAKYAEQEMTCPMRTVTSTVRLVGSADAVLLPVKTAAPVPKAKIAECLAEIKAATARVPVAIGDVVKRNLAGTGVDLVATGDAPAS